MDFVFLFRFSPRLLLCCSYLPIYFATLLDFSVCPLRSTRLPARLGLTGFQPVINQSMKVEDEFGEVIGMHCLQCPYEIASTRGL